MFQMARVAYALAGVIVLVNVSFLATAVIQWRLHTTMSIEAAEAITATVLMIGVLYTSSLAYLALRYATICTKYSLYIATDIYKFSDCFRSAINVKLGNR